MYIYIYIYMYVYLYMYIYIYINIYICTYVIQVFMCQRSSELILGAVKSLIALVLSVRDVTHLYRDMTHLYVWPYVLF